MVEASTETVPEAASDNVPAKVTKAVKRKDRRKKLLQWEIKKNVKAKQERKRLNAEFNK